MESEWNLMVRTPWNAASYPPGERGKKAVRDAVKRLTVQERIRGKYNVWREYRWNVSESGQYIIEWRRV